MRGIHTLDAQAPLPWDLLPAPLTIIDFETTGLSQHQHRIVEMALVRLEPNAKPRAFETLINPDEPIDASWIHGITDDMVVGAPAFSDVVPLMRELLDGAILTAHNAPFEVRFLNAELSRLGGSWGGRRLCTMSLARMLHPERRGPGSSKLVNLAELYELSGYESHRALADVITTTMLLGRMLESKKADHDIGAVLKKVIKPVKEPALWPEVGPVTAPLLTREAIATTGTSRSRSSSVQLGGHLRNGVL